MDDLKLQVHEKLPQSENKNDTKSLPTAVRNNSSSKNKLESSKYKRKKPLGLSYVKASTKTDKSPKSNVKEYSYCDKLSEDQNKVSINDQPASLKNISTKMVKCEKGGDSEDKSKSKNIPSKSSDKLKYLPAKHEKTKKLTRVEKTPDSKFDNKMLSESSSSSDKESRRKLQYSSFYESFQGTDPDRSLTSNVSSKEKPKHFSKHYQKESSSTDSSDKQSSDKKQSQSDSDSGTPKKDKGRKSSKHKTEENKKTSVHQETAKISSRSDSLGSMSSTSDSQSSMKGTSGNFFHTSAELSFIDETPFSQESSDDSEKDSQCSNSNLIWYLNSPEISNDVHDIHDIFLLSSSSSEFEGFSSPKNSSGPLNFESDASSVHTDDLSSFDDEFSEDYSRKNETCASAVQTRDLSSFDNKLREVECSSDLFEKDESNKRFTIKEECLPGKFGKNYEQEFHYKNGAACDHSGACPCGPGWSSTFSQTPCTTGFHGLECNQSCDCRHGINYNPETGFCHCPPGKNGDKCLKSDAVETSVLNINQESAESEYSYLKKQAIEGPIPIVLVHKLDDSYVKELLQEMEVDYYPEHSKKDGEQRNLKHRCVDNLDNDVIIPNIIREVQEVQCQNVYVPSWRVVEAQIIEEYIEENPDQRYYWIVEERDGSNFYWRVKDDDNEHNNDHQEPPPEEEQHIEEDTSDAAYIARHKRFENM